MSSGTEHLGSTTPYYTWRPDQLDQRTTFDEGPKGQQAELRLSPECSLYAYRLNDDAPVEHFLLVNLHGSAFNPAVSGHMEHDDLVIRGFYTEFVTINIGIEGPPGEIVVISDTPETTEESGSRTVDSGINWSASAGFFGLEPTATVSTGGSINNSYTDSMEDFAIKNDTTDAMAVHTYSLAMVSGAAYKSTSDLDNADWSKWFRQNFHDVLYELPLRAKANLPLLSQVLFHAPKPLVVTPGLPSLHRTVVISVDWGVAMITAVPAFATTRSGHAQMLIDVDFSYGQ